MYSLEVCDEIFANKTKSQMGIVPSETIQCIYLNLSVHYYYAYDT